MRTKLMMILAIVTTPACAGITVHEHCSDPDVASRYRDYDQCYTEVAAKGGPGSFRKALGAVLQGTSEGLQQASQRKPSCVSMPNGYGSYRTTCN
jgi:hypothetical protein